MQNKNQKIRHSIFRSSAISLGLIIAFVVLVYLADTVVGHFLSHSGLVFAGVVIAFVPAVIWLTFFYSQDRLEPEPKGMVLQVFVLGGLVAAAIGIPSLENLFAVQDWIYVNPWITLAGSVLVVGVVQETLKYAAVRFTVYTSHEFDELTDGIIYAMAAGLGYAMVINISFIINGNGVDLGLSAIRVSLNSLAHACFSGVMGYFLGCAKFQNKPVWWQVTGVALAALLNGIFFSLWGSLSKPRISVSQDLLAPWLGFILAVILSGVIMFVLSYLIRHNQSTSAGKRGGL